MKDLFELRWNKVNYWQKEVIAIKPALWQNKNALAEGASAFFLPEDRNGG
jgi:hypothetical protein